MEKKCSSAGIYLRISNDATGDALGVQRQEADARKLCEAKGWHVVEIFSDNDKSAYDRRKKRPRYLDMLEAIRERKIDVVVAWHPDRLHRQLRELVGFIDLIDEFGVHVETVQAGHYELSTTSGQMQAHVLGTVAQYESGHKSDRVKRKLEANAAEGRHHGGQRAYGWTNDRKTLEPAEADVIREMAARVLAGESCKGIARELNAAGHRTSTGRLWRDVTVREMVLRPRNAGLRVHHGEVVEGIAGQWESLLPAEDFHQVVAVLSNPARRTHPGKDGRVHLLSAIARCGVCDAPMTVARGKPYKGTGKSIYRCKRGHIVRDQASVDDLVTRVIVGRLAQDDVADLLAEPDRLDEAQAAAVRVQALQDRLNDVAEAYAADAMTLGQMTIITTSLRAQLAEAQTVAASPSRSKVLGDLVNADDPAAAWEQMTPQRRRAVVDLLVSIRIMPTGKGPNFNPAAVEIVLKT